MAQRKKLVDTFEEGQTTLMPYFTIGYPTYEASLDVIEACVEAGADIMELGVPFSDPLADGPTIQYSTQVALENGTTVSRCLEAVKELRNRGVAIPLILMGYFNPLLAYGLGDFVRSAAEVGVSGFIIPDLPPEEAQEMEALCRQQKIDLVFLLAPNSSAERIHLVSERSNGFIYLVSVTGITGARNTVPVALEHFIQQVRAETDKPLAVGFGISTPQQAATVGDIADGVIVGSALIKAVGNSENPPSAAKKFVSGLKAAISPVKI